MSISANKFQPIEGLSKRELSKLQRLIKRQEINKAKTQLKTSKRKSPNGTCPEEPQVRKLIATQQAVNEALSQQKSISIVSDPKLQGSPKTRQNVKKVLKELKPLNSQINIDGGEEGLFGYMLNYVFTQKQKQMDSQQQDTSFLDALEGKQLEFIDRKLNITQIKSLQKELEVEKKTIKQPFDQNHRKLLEKIRYKS